MNDSSDLTVSPEYAGKLHKAGFNQDKSYFMCVDGKIVARQTLADMGLYEAKDKAVAAPIASEILDELPERTMCRKRAATYQVFDDENQKKKGCTAFTLANATAAFYCYLSENNLLPDA